MIREGKRNKLSIFINRLSVKGRYTFSIDQFLDFLGSSREAAKLILSRGLGRKQIVSLARGFYVVAPPEYEALGYLEAAEFIPHLMAYWQEDYYVGLLSAAAVHGAAHHAPMSFQVMTTKSHRPIRIGRTSIRFYKSRYVGVLPTIKRNTQKSILQVASPEATAFDLMTHFKEAGGFGNVVTVLSELAEVLKPRLLQRISKDIYEIAYIQRLGYILDALGFSQKTSGLLKEVENRAINYLPLVPYKDSKNFDRNSKWKIIENEKVESEI